MATLVGDFIIERLGAWGVHRIYGYPGDGINGLMGAMNRAATRSAKPYARLPCQHLSHAFRLTDRRPSCRSPATA